MSRTPSANDAAASTNSPNAVMVDGVAEGVVAFSSKPHSSFRYKIEMQADKVSFWLENRTTKQQWKSKAVTEKDFVSSEDVIPHAKLPDYVQCFHNCLAAEMGNEKSDFQRDLTGDPSGALTLSFALKLRVFTSEWTPSYTFTLNPVEMEPVDVLSSKMRDQEEEIHQLRSELNSREGEVGTLRIEIAALQKNLISGGNVAFVAARNTQNTGKNQNLRWEQVYSRRGDEFVELSPHGEIKFLKSGVFDFRISIVHTSTNNGQDTFQLFKGGNRVFGCSDSNGHGYHQTSVVSCIREVTAKEKYTVMYTGSSAAYTESSLQIYMLATL